jgi:outer membrane immunogenic protein
MFMSLTGAIWPWGRPLVSGMIIMEYDMRCFAFPLLAVMAVATPAFAQGSAPFTGPRIEGIVGWDQMRNHGHDQGAVYGLGAGYDVQMGGAIVGLEGELSDSDVRQHQYDVFATGDRLTAKAGRDLYVGARIGKVVGGRTLLYAKAGYTNERARLIYDDGTTAGLNNFRDHTDLDGVRLGAGAEYALGRNSYLKAEYRYSNYEKGFTRNQLVGGFGFRF